MHEHEHETYIRQVADLALARLPKKKQSKIQAKLCYGAGQPGLRGVTYYSVWQNGEPEPIPFVEICAFGEEDDVQLAGTTIHELAHVLAGSAAGHGKDWRRACERLGLRRAKAAGNVLPHGPVRAAAAVSDRRTHVTYGRQAGRRSLAGRRIAAADRHQAEALPARYRHARREVTRQWQRITAP